jgi:hypothetical protein
MQRDVLGAVKFVEAQIARLLSGRVELWELVMTGGLWRVTGQQLERAAAAAAAGEGAEDAWSDVMLGCVAALAGHCETCDAHHMLPAPMWPKFRGQESLHAPCPTVLP